jgi:deoxyribose-phosphate aldolase
VNTPAKPDLAAVIDHTVLKPEANRGDAMKAVSEAVEHGFASVCVNGVFAAAVADTLKDTGVKTCAVAGFPLGAMKPTIKAIEATNLVKDGADEVDFVAHLPHLLAEDLASIKAEFAELVKGVRSVRSSVVVKVIIESALLMKGVDEARAEARIAAACRAARETGCDFVKTSTGFHPAGGATEEAVRMMKRHAGPMKVKASGGIRTHQDARRMLEAGADRLGCSASVAIVQGQGADAAGY